MEQTWLAELQEHSRELPGDPVPPPQEGGRAADAESARVVIGTVLDGAATQIQAGQGMQRVLLTAATGAVPAQPVVSALRNPVDRQAVRDHIGGGLWPQAVLRLGTTATLKAARQQRSTAASCG
jgi:hypothetical protein